MDRSLEREIRRLYSRFHSPGDPHGRAFVPLADAYRRAGDLQRARLLLDEGLRRHPWFASAHVVAMRIARDVSDRAGVLSATRRVLELDPGNAEARRTLAEAGPLAGEVRSPRASASRDEGEDGLPDESWMAGDAGAWGAGADSGLASVDAEALEDEERRAAARETEEREAAREREETREAERRKTAREAEARAAEREAETLAVVREDEEDEGPTQRETTAARREAGEDPRAGSTAAPPDVADGEADADADICTRTMGRVYEQQGLLAQAIAVYERLLESDPGDDALAARLERLRRQVREGPSASAGSGAPPDGEGFDLAREASGEFASSRGASAPSRERPDAAPDPEDRVVPIETLAPDAPAADARGEAP